MISVAVIGVGFMGERHAKTFLEIPEVKLKAVCDADAEKARHVGQLYKAKPYTDYLKMLHTEELDAVTIAAPTRLHSTIALAVTDHVKNILVEKPLASTLREADKLVQVVKEKNVKLMVGQIERFNPAVGALKNLILAENLGSPIACFARRIGPYSPRIRDQGVILGLAIHDIDIMRYLLGSEVKRVYSRGFSKVSKFEDYASLILDFDNGVLGTIETSQITPQRERLLNITFPREYVIVNLLTQDICIHDIGQKEGQIKGDPRQIKVKKQDSLRLELQHFMDVVSGKEKKLKVDGEEGLRDLQVALGAIRSIETGAPVELI